MIVVDASAAVTGLLNDGPAREALAQRPIAIPHLADSEIVQALRSMVLRGDLTEDHAADALDVWRRLGMKRFDAVGLIPRMWELRKNLSGYDSTYVALAEALSCELLTTDSRLAKAPGPTCSITFVRS